MLLFNTNATYSLPEDHMASNGVAFAFGASNASDTSLHEP